MIIEIFDRQSLKNTDIQKSVIELDIKNMKEIFERSEMEHPLDKRRKGFDHPGVIIAAFDNHILTGYIEYGSDWTNSDDIYISSIQIVPKYRDTLLFAKLLRAAIDNLRQTNFRSIVFNVQKTNLNMIKICKKLGFSIVESENKPESYRFEGNKNTLFKKI